MIANILELDEGKRLLDLGCGLAGPMRSVAHVYILSITYVNTFQRNNIFSICLERDICFTGLVVPQWASSYKQI